MQNHRVSGNMFGQMDSFTKGSGLMVQNMAQECGKGLEETVISESGRWATLKDMAFMFGSMETDTRANSSSF